MLATRSVEQRDEQSGAKTMGCVIDVRFFDALNEASVGDIREWRAWEQVPNELIEPNSVGVSEFGECVDSHRLNKNLRFRGLVNRS